MELPKLIAELSQPGAYPFAVGAVDVRQTHISVVFLAGDFAYKLKKPVNLDFLDFSALEKRRHFCEEEVRLNRRLAREVYLGVVPVARDAGRLRFEGECEPIEWAVKMQRLPEGASLLSLLERDELSPGLLAALAGRLAAFHASALGGPLVAESGRFEVVARNARENFAQTEAHVGATVSREVFDRVRELTEEALARLKPLIEARAARGVPRDGHGDLHLDHVYHFPGRAPPGDLVAIDCIEFAERFRHADPVADAAFLVMDLAFRGRRDLAHAFAASYFRAAGDAEGEALLPFYTAYRAVVRAKVDGIKSAEGEIPEASRERAAGRARAYWLFALGELEEPARRPCLVLVAGLPGSGKSTLARGLAERAGFAVIRSDVVRKELAGLAPKASARGAPDTGIYAPEWTERTYAECLRRAEALLREGGRVIVDANFPDDERRRAFLGAATRLGVRAVLLWCRVSPEVAKARIAGRTGDASDADAATFDRAAERWQPFSAATERVTREVNANGMPAETRARALGVLREVGLLGAEPSA
jgi:aminoglycoside phosphotransferase family enzyme/predicted kinase